MPMTFLGSALAKTRGNCRAAMTQGPQCSGSHACHTRCACVPHARGAAARGQSGRQRRRIWCEAAGGGPRGGTLMGEPSRLETT
jgi:hypothetical protein